MEKGFQKTNQRYGPGLNHNALKRGPAKIREGIIVSTVQHN